MGLVLVILSFALIVLSLGGVFLPSRLMALVDKLASRKLGLWGAVSVRIVFGVLLWLSSQESNAPEVLKVFSVLLVFSAVAHFVVGRERLRKLRQILAAWPLWVIRVPCLLGIIMGVYLLWALSPFIPLA
ncbi:hypothetical protein GCM10008090_27760 [Arenicella chitinivorans]|uniref:Uncharacterized protein n=1 Tax=Arenicella chitinivorans TaxID=1329800 RepID=A0A918RYM9_9GAMM|nr:hypothetical protein [Arenicella chitinivorans]GHA16397.1 hypothetical protein GCM10008090_27760 [Arenicella chitinivorans]